MAEALPEVPDLVAPQPDRVPQYPYNIAAIVDNVVYQILNVDGNSAALYLSQPKFVQVGTDAKVGWVLNEDGSFTNPVSDNIQIDNSGV